MLSSKSVRVGRFTSSYLSLPLLVIPSERTTGLSTNLVIAPLEIYLHLHAFVTTQSRVCMHVTPPSLYHRHLYTTALISIVSYCIVDLCTLRFSPRRGTIHNYSPNCLHLLVVWGKSIAFLRVTRKEREGLDQRSSTSKPSKSMFALFAQGNTRRRIDAQVRERRWWRRGRSGLGECGLLYWGLYRHDSVLEWSGNFHACACAIVQMYVCCS